MSTFRSFHLGGAPREDRRAVQASRSSAQARELEQALQWSPPEERRGLSRACVILLHLVGASAA
eukprot:6938335-Pyramimonas_sp.AAC.1